MRPILIMSFIAGFAASGLSAQGLSDDELLEIMQQQRDALSGQGATRGLKIVTGANESEPDTSGATVQDTNLTSLADIQSGDIVRFDEALEINVQINFEFDSATLRTSEQPALDQMCRVIKKAEGPFRIIGHTDSAGSDTYNQKLSQLRAEEVKRHLTSASCGISATRLKTLGYGEAFPNNESDPRAPENRRVEFQALS